MSVAVIVPVYNGADVLPRTVPTALALDDVDEWVWVDDGSTDGSADVLRELTAQEPRARVVRQSHNLGRSAARNRGIAETVAETLVFFDCDVRPPTHAADALVAPLQAEVVTSVASIRPMLGERVDPYAVYLRKHPRGPSRSLVGASIPWRYFLAGASALRRSVVQAAGGFDETVPYGEDVALACRIAQKHPNGLALADVEVDLYGVGSLGDAIRNVRTFGLALHTIEATCPDVLQVVGVRQEVEALWLRRLAAVPVPAGGHPLLKMLPQPLQARAVRYLLGHALLAAYHGA